MEDENNPNNSNGKQDNEQGKRKKSVELPEESEYYKHLRRTEFKKSDASLFPSYTNLIVP